LFFCGTPTLTLGLENLGLKTLRAPEFLVTLLMMMVMIGDVQEEKHNQKAAEAAKVDLFAQIPPIEKMDPALTSLVLCE